jgi:hypothetical protein
MHPTADTLALMLRERRGAAGDAGRYAANSVSLSMLNRNRYILSKPQWVIVLFVAFCCAVTFPLAVYARRALGQWFGVIRFTGELSIDVALTSLVLFLALGAVVGLWLHKGNVQRRRNR